jgi:hypothetical protein
LKPLFWISVGSVAAGAALLLIVRKPVEPRKTYGESARVALDVPAGWRRVTEVTPELRAKATALRASPGFSSMAYGTLAPFVASDGKTYATWIEQHYHEPGGTKKPWGLHHGVTLLTVL